MQPANIRVVGNYLELVKEQYELCKSYGVDKDYRYLVKEQAINELQNIIKPIELGYNDDYGWFGFCDSFVLDWHTDSVAGNKMLIVC